MIRHDLALFLARLLPSKCPNINDAWGLFCEFRKTLLQLEEVDLAKLIERDIKPMDQISKATFYEQSVSLWKTLAIDVHNLRHCIIDNNRLNQVHHSII